MDEARLAREIKGEIEEATGEKVNVSVEDSVAALSGRFSSLQKVVEAGHIAARSERVRGVVEEIACPGKTHIILPPNVPGDLQGSSFDVAIVGGGVIGLSIARELSRFNLSIALLERHDDLGMDQTVHSNATIHPAVVTEHGTLKWEMNYRGNPMWDGVAADLDVAFKRIGALIVAEKPEEEMLLPLVKEAALKQNDPAPLELERPDLDTIEPGLAQNVRKGVLIWNTGIISVFDLVLAYAENAIANGVEIFRNTAVTGIRTEDGCIRAVDTTRGTIGTRILVNAAGLYSDIIAALAGDRFFTIHPRKGETIIFDKSYQPARTVLTSVSMAAERSQYTKGGGIIPTIDGNLQFGPTAEEVCNREDVATTPEGTRALLDRFGPLLQRLKPGCEPPERGRIITQFAGCRAATYKEDFIIEASRKVKGLVHAAGIQSPGLASAPAIAERVKDIIVEEWRPSEKKRFEPCRKRAAHFWELNAREKADLIRENPLYGHIVCRCEQASEGEIVDSVHGRVPATTIDAIKRRTRAGMGRCQGGFCMPRVLEIISREAGIDRERVTKCGGGSFILKEKTRPVKE